MLLRQMDVSKVLILNSVALDTADDSLFISNTFCPCFHDTTSLLDFVSMSLSNSSLVLTISSSYSTLPLNAWKYQEPLLDSLLILIPFIYVKDMHFHDFTYNLRAVFLELSHRLPISRFSISSHLFDIWIAHSHLRFNMYKTSYSLCKLIIYFHPTCLKLANLFPLPLTSTNHLLLMILPYKCLSSASTSF